MVQGQDPKWLRWLSKHISWLAVPNLAIVLIVLQALGFLLIYSDPSGYAWLVLIPNKILHGEFWRLGSFLAIPLSHSPIWVIFSLYFSYFILNSIEAEWGEFKLTLYVLVSLVVTIIFSFLFGYPITQVSDFYSTLFLAAAALFPNFEIQIYFLFPVKMKVLGWLALGYLVVRLFQGEWIDRFFLIAIYSNYLLFFGPTILYRIRDWKRRRDYRAKFRS